MIDDQTTLIEALQSPEPYEHGPDTIELVETHISWVLLTGRYAYKIKKAVRLPFLDFSTLALRERYCHDELDLNRRLAPDLYLDVIAIGGTPKAPRIGAAPPIEFAVRMKQFPANATADQLIRADALTATDFATLAERLAGFHAGLEPSSSVAADKTILENLDELEAALQADDGSSVPALVAAMRDEVERRLPTLRDRAHTGFVRECHGDLHLGNIARIDERLVPFDCLEFDRELRTIDPIDETAFLWMDLLAQARQDLAFAFLNAYLETSGDFAGLRILRLYAAHRALVRAKVAAIAQDGEPPVRPGKQARAYLGTAAAQLGQSGPCLIITSGLSASGKSTIARQLAPLLGAVHCRSDVERKRLHGMVPTERRGDAVDRGLYAPAATAATYTRLAEAAGAALGGRIPIIVDAALLSRDRRTLFRALAREYAVPFLILRCEASTDTLRARIAARKGDASDANLEVLEHQLATADVIDSAEQAVTLTVDTGSEVEIRRLAAIVAGRCQSSPSSTSY
jgi:hypothetical protein